MPERSRSFWAWTHFLAFIEKSDEIRSRPAVWSNGASLYIFLSKCTFVLFFCFIWPYLVVGKVTYWNPNILCNPFNAILVALYSFVKLFIIIINFTKWLSFLFPAVHRDIKPTNVLLQLPSSTEALRVRISDFGLCKQLEVGHLSFTKHSGITGTEGWIAPEMIAIELPESRPVSDSYNINNIN